MNLYFGGPKVRIDPATVTARAAENFRELVEQCFNIPVQIRMSREKYFSLDEDTQKLVKDGPYITACSFKSSPCVRNKENADKLVLVALDIDDPISAAQYATSPEALSDALAPYNFVSYVTATHRPDAPRMRIIVDVIPCDKAFQKTLSRYVVTELLGFPPDVKGIKESEVVSQPMYLPVQFEGEAFTAVIASRTDGEPLDPDLIHLPDVPAERRYSWEGYDGFSDDTYSLASLPVLGITVEDLREPLMKLDPDCDYREWNQIACALRHQFRGDDAKDAYLLFDEWSSGGTKYKGEKETYAKWRSFKPELPGRAPVTVRSLFKRAIHAGWSCHRLGAKLKQSFEEWLAECSDIDIAMSEGCDRIAAMPFQNDVVEESMIVRLRARLRELGGQSIDKATIAKQVRHARSRKRREEAAKQQVPAWLRPYVFIRPYNQFRNASNGLALPPAAFDNSFGCELMPKEQDTAEGAPPGRVGRPTVTPTDYALNVHKIVQVDGVTYDPTNASVEPIFKIDNMVFLNEYRLATVPVEDPLNAAAAGEMVMRLLHKLIGNRRYEEILLHWLAAQVQYPGRKIKWSPYIQSGQGAGKGLICDILAAAIGPANFRVVSPTSMAGNFNDWAYGAHVLNADEMWSPGTNRAENANKIKGIITNITIDLATKHKDVRWVPNRTNVICTSNYVDAIHLDDSDRRYFVLRSPLQEKSQVVELTESGFFIPYSELVENGGGALRSWFKTVRIPDDFRWNGPAPATEFREELADMSKNRLLAAIEDTVGTDPLVGRDIIHLTRLESLVGHLTARNHSVEHFLTQMDYHRHGGRRKRVIAGQATEVWVHRRSWDEDFGDPAATLEERAQRTGLQDLEKSF